MSDHTQPIEPAAAQEVRTEQELPHWRVEASFYVQAATSAEARSLVERELNSGPVLQLVGDTVGDADVHDDVEAWDPNG